MASTTTNTTNTTHEDEPVYFWHAEEVPYGAFGQWYWCSIKETQDGGSVIDYKSAEQYMMRRKALLFGDARIAEKLLHTTEPRKQKALGRKVEGFNEKVWEPNRSKVVEEGNYLKFAQDPELKALLLGTGERELAEASPFDRVWGIGFTSKEASKNRDSWGLNLLGKALMAVRQFIRKEDQQEQEK